MKDYLHEDDLFLVESYFYNEHHLLPCTFRFVKKDYTMIWIEASIDFVTTHVGEKEREIVLKMKVFEDRPSKKSRLHKRGRRSGRSLQAAGKRGIRSHDRRLAKPSVHQRSRGNSLRK